MGRVRHLTVLFVAFGFAAAACSSEPPTASAEIDSGGSGRSGVDCGATVSSFEGQSLNQPEFVDDLRCANFVNTELAQPEFVDVDISGANFTGASLAQAEFVNATVIGADFAGATFSQGSITNTDFSSSDLRSATLVDTVWSNVTCPDGTNSNDHSNTCLGNLTPTG